jgi:hypothetical protein
VSALAADPGWWDYSFRMRRKLTFNNAGQTENLTGFPVLVRLDSTRVNYAKTQNAGEDIRFVDSDNATVLAHEIELWNETGSSYVWVRVPQIDGSSTTDHIYMYYDNPAAPDGQNPGGVWDANFQMVQHLEEGSGQHQDSTSNGNDSTVVLVAAQGAPGGPIDGADTFTGTHRVEVADSASLDMTAADSFTVEAWINTLSGGDQVVVSKEEDAVSEYQLWLASGTAAFWLHDGPDVARADSVATLNNGAWHYVVGRWDETTSTAEVFVNGVSVGSDSNGSLDAMSGANSLFIGEEGDANGGFNFDGRIDEVRVSKVARSNDWIRAQRLSMIDVFATYGAETSQCCSLTASATATTVTVTAPSSFQMRFNAAAGGGIDQFFDLAENPVLDLAAGSTRLDALLLEGLFVGGIWYHSDQSNPGSKVDVLETTAARTVVRQEGFFEQELAAAVLPGLKVFSDYSVYPSGRMAVEWNRRATSAVNYSLDELDVITHHDGGVPLTWSAFSQTDGTFNNPGTDDFVMMRVEAAGARTDFLQILHRDWTTGNGYLGTADSTLTVTRAVEQWKAVLWQESTGAVIPAGSSEVFNSLVYFKPTNFVDHADAAVTSRRDDYTVPATLTAVAGGSQWQDAAENTGAAGDFFNEAEAAFSLNIAMPSNLSFDIAGTVANPRYQPFFKIRQWRSLLPATSVSLEGASLVSDVDYKSAVKPVARAHFAQDLVYYSSLQDPFSFASTPEIGTGGTANNGNDFPAARFGNGARIDADGEYLSIPSAGNFDPAQGAIEFWYRPFYDYGTGALADDNGLFGYWIDGSNFFFAFHQPYAGGAGNVDGLKIGINVAGTSIWTELGAGPAFPQFWRANEWVHLRFVWDTSPQRLEIYVNGVRANPAPGGSYPSPAAVGPTFYIGDRNESGTFTDNANGVIDEFRIYSSPDAPAPIAHGGLTSDAREYLADGADNFPLSLAGVDGATSRGRYLFFGADSKFRGLNVALATVGAGVGDSALQWFYWDGGSWSGLGPFGLVDQTKSFKSTGTVYWTSDPTGWVPYSVNGGPELYYVMARLSSGSVYSTTPVEMAIKTDILLFQYCGNITQPAQTFVFSAPLATAVKLLSFEAEAGDSEVALTWRTGSELDNLGFHLFRSASAAGPYERITTSLIPGLGSSPEGMEYSYFDRGLTNGIPYFYKLLDVETSGKSEEHGPVSAEPSASEGEPPEDGDSPEPELRFGDPANVSFRILERTPRGMVVELETGGFFAFAEEDGASLRLSVPGFSEEAEPGAPAIPVMRRWLETAAGKRIAVTSVREENVLTFSSLRPSAAPVPEIVASARGAVRPGRRPRAEGARFRGPGFFPVEPARILSEGYQGEEKKAWLELSPLRWHRTTGELRLARRLVVEIRFSGREATHREGRAHARRSVAKRLVVRERGLYAVSFEELLGARGPRVAPSSIRLSRLGETVPYHLEPSSPRFGPGSVLYFVTEGERLNPYDREAVYEVELSSGGETMEVSSAQPSGGPVPLAWRRLEREENHYYQAGLVEAQDLWFWDLLLAPTTKSFPFDVAALAPVTDASRVTVWLQGTSDFPAAPDHHLRISINGVPLGEAWLEGKESLRLEADVPASTLRPGSNLLEISNLGDTSAPYSMVMLDRFEVEHPILPGGASGLWEGEFREAGVAELSGFHEGAHLVELGTKPRWLTGADAGLRLGVEPGRYLAVDGEFVLKPEVRSVPASRLKNPRNRADYLVLGPKALLEAARPLLERRRSQGLSTMAVPLEEIYSEFGHGEKRPEAIHELLAYAFHHWRKPSPRYVLLLGDATYDFKDHLGTGVVNQLPPLLVRTSYLWTASDPSYAAVNGEDVLPDLAVGRLPAASPAEAARMVRKILDYEDGPDADRSAIVVADNRDEAGDFEANAEEIAARLSHARVIQLSRLGVEETRDAIVEGFDQGPWLLSYVGHGGIQLWAQENVFDTERIARLSEPSRQPLLLTLNCLNGYFHFPFFDSLAEGLLKAEGKGAIAAFSPSGLSLNAPAHELHKALVDELASARHARLGDAVLAAQAAYAERGFYPELLSIYHLLGDPALPLR